MKIASIKINKIIPAEDIIPGTASQLDGIDAILSGNDGQYSMPVSPATAKINRQLKLTLTARNRKIKKLMAELATAHAAMLAFKQLQETLQEELKSINEEIVASNEDLQVVNDELQIRNDLLTESYDYSEAVIATIHEPMLILDKDLRVKSANQSFYSNFVVARKDTEGTLLYDLGNGQWNIPKLSKLLASIITSNTDFYNFEVTHQFPGIGEKIMLLNARRIVQKSHGVQLILLAIEDVTEIRIKTLALQLKERELSDKDARERQADNERLEKAVEARIKELAQVNKELLFELVEKEKRAAALIVANSELVFQNGEKEKREAELIIANDELAFQNGEKEKRAAELIVANSELIFQNGEREKRGAELIIANDELAFQNVEKEKRSAELVSANKELEAFTYIASHDLQEPLRKIQTFSATIMEKENENLSPKGKDYFRRMQLAAGRMQKLIEDLLFYSRTNAINRTFEKTDLRLIIEEVKADLQEVIEEKHATIDASDMCDAYIIPFQFRQLMYNLIGNALKFSRPQPKPHIIITSNVVEGLGMPNPGIKYCHITVADNGIGFEPEYNEQIFELFKKLHGKEEYEGTGLGLAIVKKIVENHDGFITATSQLNEGATFDIYIPAFVA